MPQYVPLGTVDAPASWTLPPSLQLQLEAAFAHYDGTSAAGAYLPCLKVISDSGHTVGMYRANDSVAAGASVEATWGPFLGRGGAAAAATAAPWALCSMPNSTVTVAAAGNANFGSATPVDAFYTNDAATFSYALNTDLSLYGISVLKTGHYALKASFQVTLFGAGAIDLYIALSEGPGFVSSGGSYGGEEILSSTPVYSDGSGSAIITQNLLCQVNSHSVPAPAPAIVWNVSNNGANTAHLLGVGYSIYQLDTDSTHLT